MRKCNLFILLSLSAIIGLNSCQKDIYNPKAIWDDYFIQDIPAGFDWATLSTVQIQVFPNDTYGGQYFYTIELFEQNPLVHPEATLYAKGVAKQSRPFTADVTLPDTKTTLYVRQTDPTGKKSIQMGNILNGKLVCNFAPSQATSAAISQIAKASTPRPQVDWQIPSDAIEISGSGTYTMVTNKTYILSGTFTGSIIFPPEGSGTLYVTGTWNNQATETSITKNSAVYVLNGGKVLSENAWDIPTNEMTIAIAQGGQWGEENAYDINWDIKNPSLLINDGIFYANQVLTRTQNSNIYNQGEFHVQGLTTRNPSYIENKNIFTANTIDLNNPELVNEENAVISAQTLTTGAGTVVNKNKITATTINFNGTEVNNQCKIQTEEVNFTGGKYEQASYTSLFCDKMYATGADINLNSYSLISVKGQLSFSSRLNNIKGNGNEFAVLNADELIWTSTGPHVRFGGNLEVNCSKFQDNPPYSPVYALLGAAYFSEDGTSVKIPASDCTGEGNTPDDGDPTNPTFPYPESMTQNHTWIIEDTYPNPGDYDMNDLVVGIDSVVRMMNEKYEAQSLTLYMRVRAIGGTRRIGAALQLDGIAPSTVKSIEYSDGIDFSNDMFNVNSQGVETGQTYAVIPFFDNAHKLLGVNNTTTIINTISQGELQGAEKEPKNIRITIHFNNPVAGSVLTLNKLNFFTVIASTNNPRATEIHLPEFSHTDKSTTQEDIQENTQGLMWGLLLPGKFLYAEERIDIRQAYPKFESWINSNKEKDKDWYEHPNTANIYQKQ